MVMPMEDVFATKVKWEKTSCSSTIEGSKEWSHMAAESKVKSKGEEEERALQHLILIQNLEQMLKVQNEYVVAIKEGYNRQVSKAMMDKTVTLQLSIGLDGSVK